MQSLALNAPMTGQPVITLPGTSPGRPPALMPVPNQFKDLTLKLSRSGVLELKTGRFKKRYTGSRTSAVDINGNLHIKKKSLDLLMSSGDDKKKDGRHRNAAADGQRSLHENKEKSLSTKGKSGREYIVNKKEIRQRLIGWINTSAGKKELYFWTITFFAGMSDDLCYQAFNTWLTTLRQKKWLRNYLWVAERQDGKRLKDSSEATNTIHFHVAIPHKMSVKHANIAMQTILKTFVAKGLLNKTKHQCKKYNGVDIAKHRKTKKVTNFAIKKGSRALATYMSKYIVKNNEKFSHLAWHNSRGFSMLFTGITCTMTEFCDAHFEDLVILDPIFDNEYFTFYAWREHPPNSFCNHIDALNDLVQSYHN